MYVVKFNVFIFRDDNYWVEIVKNGINFKKLFFYYWMFSGEIMISRDVFIKIDNFMFFCFLG